MLGKKLIPLAENRAAAEMREMVSYLLESEESFGQAAPDCGRWSIWIKTGG